MISVSRFYILFSLPCLVMISDGRAQSSIEDKLLLLESQMTEVVKELKDELTLQKIEVAALKKENIDLKAENSEIKDLLVTLKENGLSQLVRSSKRLLLPESTDTNIVAFTTVLTKDVPLGPHQTVEYDKVITNIGSGYDARHGHFTAPVHGVYMISASSCSVGDQGIHTEIVLNGQQIAAMYGDDYDIGSHSVVVELQQNDMVWVRHFDESNSVIHSGADRYYSSFSGVLLNTL